jgi:hypothetical protein
MALYSAPFQPPDGLYGIAFDGENIWLAGAPYIIELRDSDGKQLRLLNAPDNSTGIAFDGANIWVAMFNSKVVAKL